MHIEILRGSIVLKAIVIFNELYVSEISKVFV